MLYIDSPDSQNMFIWEYGLPVLVGLLLLTFFPSTKHYQKQTDIKKYRLIQIVVLLAAVIGAKFTVLAAEYNWPMQPTRSLQELLMAGRSIVGGLLFGFLVAELAKPIAGYKLPPNDRFAMVLPFSVAIGRVGCLLAGCCRGLPFESRFSISYNDHIARHAIPLYEMTFHMTMGILFINLVTKEKFKGKIFAIYLIAYGSFRFLTEFIRVTPKTFQGHSLYQWFSLLMICCGFFSLFWHRKNKQTQLKMA